jgi:hypothetical protein
VFCVCILGRGGDAMQSTSHWCGQQGAGIASGRALQLIGSFAQMVFSVPSCDHAPIMCSCDHVSPVLMCAGDHRCAVSHQ